MIAMRKVLAIVVISWAAACTKDATPEKALGQEAAADFVRYPPGKAPLGFIKIEAAHQAAGTTAVSLPGRVTFDEDRTQRVASPIDGRAVRIAVKLGDNVKAGQPLIQLWSPSVGQLQADAQKALSDLSLSEKSLDRVHKLQADGAIAEKEVAQAESDHRKAKSDLGRTSAQLKALGVSPTDPAVNVALRAQIPGTVVDRNVLVGQELRADQATPLLTISSLDTVWVLADVYEQDLGLVHEGDKVTVTVPAYPGDTFSGNVKHIGDVVDPSSRTVKIRCVIANPQHRLKPEMYAKVVVENLSDAKSIRIPSRAVLNEGDSSLVVVATEGETFRLRHVDVGPESDGFVRVLKGVIPGEMIVTDGAIFMKREIESQ
jgi:cobalt-zinc-cadmium efflux system membrane fusion protein